VWLVSSPPVAHTRPQSLRQQSLNDLRARLNAARGAVDRLQADTAAMTRTAQTRATEVEGLEGERKGVACWLSARHVRPHTPFAPCAAARAIAVSTLIGNLTGRVAAQTTLSAKAREELASLQAETVSAQRTLADLSAQRAALEDQLETANADAGVVEKLQ
jgi:uncharacterized protein YlxW (UPF0749 family)